MTSKRFGIGMYDSYKLVPGCMAGTDIAIGSAFKLRRNRSRQECVRRRDEDAHASADEATRASTCGLPLIFQMITSILPWMFEVSDGLDQSWG